MPWRGSRWRSRCGTSSRNMSSTTPASACIGYAADRDRDELLGMIDLNMRALTDLSLAFVDSLARHRGGILNVASVAGFLPGAGVGGLLRQQGLCALVQRGAAPRAQAAGVRVTTLCPGPVQTEFQARAGVMSSKTTMFHVPAIARRREGYRGLMRGKRHGHSGLWQQGADPAAALRAALLAARRGRQAAALAADQSRTAYIAAPRGKRLQSGINRLGLAWNLPALRWAFACHELSRQELLRHEPLPHEPAGPDRPASGALDARPGRQRAQEPRLPPRHPPPALRRSAARHVGEPRRRRDLRRPAERQRQGRFHPPRDRLAQGAVEGEETVSRHLPRRADAGAPARRQGAIRIRMAMPRSATTRSARRRRAARSARTGPITSISGTARASSCRAARRCWRRATPFRCRRSATAARPSRCNSTWTSPTP